MTAEAECHRRVVPGSILIDLETHREVSQQQSLSIFKIDAPRDVRLNDPQRRAFLCDLQMHAWRSIRLQRQIAILVPDRLFPEEDTPVQRSPRKQVLRSLRDKMPPKMTEADQVRISLNGARFA